MSRAIIISMYKPKECKVLFESPNIEILDSKATNANGYIYGCITNTTGEVLENKFIKLDCYSEYDNNINSRLCSNIVRLEPGESQYFVISYRCEGTERAEISMSDTAPEYLLDPIDITLTQTQKSCVRSRYINCFILYASGIFIWNIIINYLTSLC